MPSLLLNPSNRLWRCAGALLLALALLPPASHAVGLGNAEVKSRLNEQLLVHIPLRGLRRGEGENLRARIADDASFARAGLDRAAIPPGIRLDVRGAGRDAYVEMRTRKAVREPHVGFVLALESRDEVVERAYQLLIDYQ